MTKIIRRRKGIGTVVTDQGRTPKVIDLSPKGPMPPTGIPMKPRFKATYQNPHNDKWGLGEKAESLGIGQRQEALADEYYKAVGIR